MEKAVRLSDRPCIKESTLIYMIPFYIKRNYSEFVSDIWERATMTMEKGILYSHIQRFMGSSVNGEINNLEPHDYQIFSLKTPTRKKDNDSYRPEEEHLKSIHRMLKYTYFVSIAKNSFHPIPFKFSNKNDTFLSPKLIICPNAKTGILLFAIEPICKTPISMSALQSLNYILFKSYSEKSTEAKPIVLSSLIDQWDLWQEHKEIVKPEKSLKAQLSTLYNNKDTVKDEKKIQKINETILKLENEINVLWNEEKQERINYLETTIKKKLEISIDDIYAIDNALSRPKTNIDNVEELMGHHWIICDFTNQLMADLNGILKERADQNRMHLFAYIQMEKTDIPENQELLDFSRLIRCQDKDYMVIPTTAGMPTCQKLYENIYVGSTVEGGGILTFLEDPNNSFIKNFRTGPLTKSYLWIYLLAIMQRHTLLQMSRELAEEYGYSGKDLNDQLANLRELMKEMSKTKINTYFTDVSDHSHLNAFYTLACNNLAINRYFTDVESKLNTLKETLEQLHDEKMEKIKKEEKAIDRFQNKILKWVAILALALTMFSGLNDSFDYFGNFHDPEPSPVTHAIGVLAIIIFVILLAWGAVELLEKNNKKK